MSAQHSAELAVAGRGAWLLACSLASLLSCCWAYHLAFTTWSRWRWAWRLAFLIVLFVTLARWTEASILAGELHRLAGALRP